MTSTDVFRGRNIVTYQLFVNLGSTQINLDIHLLGEGPSYMYSLVWQVMARKKVTAC